MGRAMRERAAPFGGDKIPRAAEQARIFLLGAACGRTASKADHEWQKFPAILGLRYRDDRLRGIRYAEGRILLGD
jgi:hypothetical protein